MSRRSRTWSPSPLAAFFVAFTAVAVALAFLKGLQDPDYFWHLETGELIARHGIPSTDPFSFAYDGPWVLHEWLGQLLIYSLHTAVGPVGSLFLFALLPPVALLIVAMALRRSGAGVRAVLVGTLIAGAVLVPYVTVRPQVLSWVFLAALLYALLAIRPDRPRRAWLLPALFVLWANVHGLYVIGLGVMALYCVFTLVGRTETSPIRGRIAIVGVLCFVASALTPAGPAGLLYPLRYVDSGDWGLANIPEWQSPNFHDAVQLPLLGLIVLLAVLGRGRAPLWVATVGYLAIAGALLANRNAPVAAVASFPILAMGLDGWFHGRTRPVPGPVDPHRRTVELAAAVIVAVAVAVMLPSLPGAAGVSLTRYPAAAVDRLGAHAGERVVVEYGWAGYVIRELADDGWQVFVDGRNDMYPEATLHDYSTIREAEDGWEEIVERTDADALLFPPEAPITRVAPLAGWCERLRDARQVLLIPGGCP